MNASFPSGLRNRSLRTWCLLLFLLASLGPTCGLSAAPSLPQPQEQSAHYRWAAFAEGFSEITASAVSPLLVVSSLGAVRYFRSDPSQRRDLPWFCSPAAWGFGLGLLLLCLLKDLLGAVLPAALKKPFDMLELFENKLSALVASLLFIPVVSREMALLFSDPTALCPLPAPADMQLASFVPLAQTSLDWTALTLPASLLVFFTVWMTAHSINVLIALCPIGLIDSLLKTVKGALLGLILGASLLNPFLGAFVCVLILIPAVFLAGYCFRFALFGALTAADVLLLWKPGRGSNPVHPRAFASRGFADAPPRTYGHLEVRPGGPSFFVYRPWLLLPTRRIALPGREFVLGKGILFVSLMLEDAPGEKPLKVLEFPPRYRRHVEALAAHCGVSEIRDETLLGGIRAAKAWLLETLRGGGAQETPPHEEIFSAAVGPGPVPQTRTPDGNG